MTQFEIDIINDDLESMTNRYIMSVDLWQRFNLDGLNINISNWNSIKFLDSNGAMNSEIANIPDDKGGMYMFYIRCPIIDGYGNYIMYIGRAQKTETMNLKTRIKSYYYENITKQKRPKLCRLFNKWGQYTYVAFLPLDSNDIIIELERRLVSTLTPPCNADYIITSVKQAIAAFQ